MMQEPLGHVMAGQDDEERMRQRRQKLRSIAIGVTLAVLVAIFYAATIVRLGGNVGNRPL